MIGIANDAQQDNELLRRRLRVTLYLDICVSDTPITRSGNDEEVKQFDLALLRQFLIADEKMLHKMLFYQAALYLSYRNAEDIEEWLYGSIMEPNYERNMLCPAVEQLEGRAGEYWREVRDSKPATEGYGNTLGLCTEDIFRCFSTHFVRSDIDIVEEK